MNSSLINIENMSVRLGGKLVLSEIDFSIDRGETVTIVGPNGAGKTTLLKTILGSLAPSSGRVVRKSKLRIGCVPQQLYLDKTMPITVARFLSLKNSVVGAQVEEVLNGVGIAGFKNSQMQDLSGGQFQRALLARALISNPELW